MSAAWLRLRAQAVSWWRAMLSRARFEAEMEEELRFHVEARAADLEREGHPARAAMRQAQVEMGAVAAHKDGMRGALGLRPWDELCGDLRYAARLLRKSPGFTLIAVLSLALAIGANTTIFSLANQVLFAKLGVPHPDELRLFAASGDERVAIHSSWGSWSEVNGRVSFDSFTYPVYQQLRHENRVLGDIFAFKESIAANVTADGTAQAARLELVSGNLYGELGVRPALGRAIGPADDGAPGTGAVAMISDSFWQRAFARSPQVLGKTILVNMTPVTIVGVNPPGFTGAGEVQSSPELFLPLSMIPLLKAEIGQDGPYLTSSQLAWVELMARRKPGVPDAQARAALNVALEAAVRGTMAVKKDETMPHLELRDGSRGVNEIGSYYVTPVYVLLAMVGLVLLLACANLANLMLARATARQREMGIRLALGAGRRRLVRQMLTESLLLAGMGGVLGGVLGYAGRMALPRLLESPWERTTMQVPFDWRVFCFTAAVTLATGVVFGIAPALRATHAEIGTVLKEGGKTATRRRKAWSGRTIVAFQVALSTLLVVGAVLFLRTVYNLNTIDPGFRTDHLLLVDINPPSRQYPGAADGKLLARLEEAMRVVPGVTSVTLSDVPLLANSQSSSSFYREKPLAGAKPDRKHDVAEEAYVGRDFLSVLGIPLLAGRSFTAQDAAAGRRVAVINRALAHTFFPDGNPVGQRFRMDDRAGSDSAYIEIIGVCADTRYAHLREPPPPLHFDLYTQFQAMGGATYMVRTKGDPASMVPSVRAAVARIDANLPLLDVRTQQQQVEQTMQQERMFASLSAGFGALALALACVGIYGIMAYTVSERTNEIGIRLALGARREQVRATVLREAAWLTGMGIAAGLGAAVLLGRLIGSMLYGLPPTDPASFAAAALLLGAIAIAAGWVPAARASRIEPMEALRHD